MSTNFYVTRKETEVFGKSLGQNSDIHLFKRSFKGHFCTDCGERAIYNNWTQALELNMCPVCGGGLEAKQSATFLIDPIFVEAILTQECEDVTLFDEYGATYTPGELKTMLKNIDSIYY